MINTRAGVEAENELIAGEVQAVVGFYDHTIDIQSKGKSIISIVQFSRAPGEVELVSSKLAGEIKSPADFKGKTLGITGVGSSTDFLTQFLAAKAGLKAGDYSTIGVGAGNTFVAALKQGKIDAGMTTEPTITQLLSTGDAKILIDMRSVETTQAALGGPYPAASLYVSSAWLEKNKPVAQKLTNAMVKTMKWMASHTAAEITEKMPKEYFAGNKDLYVKGLAEGKGQFTVDGRMPANGPETVLKVMSSFSKNVMGKQIDLSKTYTTELVDVAIKTVK
jgi:NitT/TauT family transport system substrate-binding protein